MQEFSVQGSSEVGFRVQKGGGSEFRVQSSGVASVRCPGPSRSISLEVEAKHLFLVATPNFEVPQFWLTAQIVPASPELCPDL